MIEAVLAFIYHKPIHVVVTMNKKGNEVYIITVYIPDKEIWTNDFSKRRE